MATLKRQCAGCGVKRQVSSFPADKRRKDGMSTTCTPCRRKTAKRQSRSSHLQRTYGITLEQYEAMFEAQGGACAICKGRRSYSLQVDHNHANGEVRGLLCKGCNKRLLPASRDSIDILEAAADYLMYPPARQALGRMRYVPDAAPVEFVTEPEPVVEVAPPEPGDGDIEAHWAYAEQIGAALATAGLSGFPFGVTA